MALRCDWSNFLFCRRSIYFINESRAYYKYKWDYSHARCYSCVRWIYLEVTASREIRCFSENRPLQKRIESEKLEIMYIVDDPFTALAFVYLHDYSTDVCGMLIAVLRRVRVYRTMLVLLTQAQYIRLPRLCFRSNNLPGMIACFSFTVVECMKGV